jgi:hypothetical protein
MDSKLFKETREELNAKYMHQIQAELQDALPHLAMAFVKQRMKQYGIDKRYLPPEFRGQVKVVHEAEVVEKNAPDV